MEASLEEANRASSRTLDIYRALEASWPGAIGYAAIGAAVLWLFTLISPPGYRAEAAVLVHHNVERVIKDPSSDEAAGYIDRETVALETLAYSDEVWEEVAQRMLDAGWIETAAEIGPLMEEVQLPHPKDGEWRFTATTNDPALSARLAQTWADTFVNRANRSVRVAVRLESLSERIRQEASALALARKDCAGLDAAIAELEGVLGELRGVDPAQGALLLEGALLTRLAGQAGVDVSAAGATTVADQIAFAERLSRAMAARRDSCMAEMDRLEALLDQLQTEAEALSGDELALSPLLEVYPMRHAEVPGAPVTRPGTALGIGAIVGLCAWVVRRMLSGGGVITETRAD